MSFIEPAECPSIKTYYGIVRTGKGNYHERILTRTSDDPFFPWMYHRNAEEGGPKKAGDGDISGLIEINPGEFRENRIQLIQARRRIDELEDELRLAQLVSRGYSQAQVTENRVREIAQEEIERAFFQINNQKPWLQREDEL